MEPTLDLLNASNITNTMALKVFCRSLIISRIRYFPKVLQDIIFIIYGQCFVLLEIISSLDKRFSAIAPLAERYTVFLVQVDFFKEYIQDSMGVLFIA